MAGKIFISYRRDDTRADARSIDQVMRRRFGSDRVFFDVDTIRKGRDFRKVLIESLSSSTVMLAVIGQHWLGTPDEQGRRRIDDPNDYVRVEIANALKRDIAVIPVLVGGAKMPLDIELPEDVRGLAYRQAAIVTHENFAHDMEAIEREVAGIVRTGSRGSKSRIVATAAGLLGLAAGAWFAVPMFGVPAPNPRTESVAPKASDTVATASRTPDQAKTAEATRASAMADPAQVIEPGSGRSFRDSGCPGVPCPEMVVVPAGEFLMGSSEEEIEAVIKEAPDLAERFKPEGPQRKVTVPQPFAVGRTNVTRAEFAAFVSATSHDIEPGCVSWTSGKATDIPAISWRSPDFEQGDSHPVVCVSWHDAVAYADWLSKLTGKRYSLLSEAEAEYATRSTISAAPQPRYHFGNDIRDICAYANGLDRTLLNKLTNWRSNRNSPCEDRFVFTSPVASYKPNAWGLYDLHGNAQYWTLDRWNESHAGAPPDTSPRTSGNLARYVVRGSPWASSAPNLRSAVRTGAIATQRLNTFGFRIGRRL